MATIDFQDGDELVLVRRRSVTVIDPETKAETTKTTETEVSVVACKENCKITGGSITTEHDDDKRFLVIRLRKS